MRLNNEQLFLESSRTYHLLLTNDMIVTTKSKCIVKVMLNVYNDIKLKSHFLVLDL